MILAPTHKPRIISELKKLDVTKVPPVSISGTGLSSPPAAQTLPKFSKPHISGELLVELPSSSEQIKFVEVRDGYLVVYNFSRLPEMKLALHHLNLQADPGGRSWTFCLTNQNAPGVPLVTISTASQQDYDRWVKTLAAELLSQTPLEAVRFLDILGITATIESTKSSTCKGKLSPDIKDSKIPPFPSRHRTVSHGADILPPLPDVVKDLPPCHLPRGGRRPSVPPPREIEHHPEWFNERLLLFESLCKHSGAKPTTQVTPSNLLVVPSNLSAKQRATSCHNLSQNPPVKDICKYFEGKNTGYLAPPVLNVEDVGILVPARSHEVAKRRFSHMDHTFTPLVRLTKHIS